VSSFAEDAAGRIVRSLSALLHKELSLVDPASEDGAQSFVLTPTLAVRDDVAFSTSGRDLVREVASVVRFAGERDGRIRELERRLAEMESDNLDLVMKNRTLAEMSARDSLTGLYNRWYVMEKIDSEMNRSLRHGCPVSVLMLDIDHFKRVNDAFGHAAGDGVLRAVAQVLRDSCRVYDVPGRYGGEEFCVVLPETKTGNTTVVAERIRERMESSSFNVGADSVVVTASIGIAGIDSMEGEGIVSPSILIDRADRALYSAKHRGRNRVELWDAAMQGAAMAH
jgi:diguanylate cyclase (GGDEF)-like protein